MFSTVEEITEAAVMTDCLLTIFFLSSDERTSGVDITLLPIFKLCRKVSDIEGIEARLLS